MHSRSPYTPTTIIITAVSTTDNAPVVLEQTTVETILNMSPENRAHYKSEKETIHLLLTGTGDEIYSTVDACKTALEMWEAIERLQQEWSRFVTILKQQQELDKVPYHKFFDILKQYQKEVNKIHAEKIAKNANPLALVAASQPHTDPYYQAPKSHKSYATTSKESPQTKSHFRNQRTVAIVRARETVGSQVVQQTGIQCFNCKQFGHFAKESRKPKRIKDFTYHKEKMLLCKQAEKGVPLQAEQSDWLVDTDEEIDERELEAY
uniref:CCHC-type domain-containing protein n=1 Tax=Tanacetum cinerariifolium TaxID=118510 RepID=A0A699H8Y2_TANCI|nr:hypothetical protein [Tanacetum cinerariifolium]